MKGKVGLIKSKICSVLILDSLAVYWFSPPDQTMQPQFEIWGFKEHEIADSVEDHLLKRPENRVNEKVFGVNPEPDLVGSLVGQLGDDRLRSVSTKRGTLLLASL